MSGSAITKGKRLPDPDLKILWQQYLRDRHTRQRSDLVMHYASLIRQVVGRIMVSLPPYVEAEDLSSYGVIGLIQAVEKFDPNRDAKFETYATTRIRGAVLDELRRQDWLPRTLRQKSKEIERTLIQLENRLGRTATDQELANELGLSLESLEQTLAEANCTVLSLDEFLYRGDRGDGLSLEDMIADESESRSPTARVEVEELHEGLAQSIDKLPERERLVITLYYYEQLTMKEIAHIMEVSEPRICQLHAQAVMRIRRHLFILFPMEVRRV